MLCCVPRKEDLNQEESSEAVLVYLNQHATSTSDHSKHEDTAEREPAPIPEVVLTSPNDEKTLQTEGDHFKTQENDDQSATSPSMPVTLEVPTKKRIQRLPRLAHQFEGAGIDGDNATETDRPSSYWSMASDFSSVSDSSTTLSYRTASSDLTRDNSPTSGGGLPVKDTMTLFRSMKDELLQGMKQLLEDRMSKMEQKFKSSQRKLETRVDDVEKRLQEMHGENGLLPTVTEDTGVNGVPSAAVLDTVREVYMSVEACLLLHICACIIWSYRVQQPCIINYCVNTMESPNHMLYIHKTAHYVACVYIID